ncbi:RNA-binding domain-containing protein [Dipodascopsis tothii]|uniref:RNA-binding domain-containing protein n=1 Tax=Dipodascopsis tothii TaxID=44089 RepID=UPI0034CE7ADF
MATEVAGTKEAAAPTPSETIYIRNINEKVKIPDLKEYLKALFSQYGQVMDVIAHKNIRMRGQAFVVFDDVQTAEQALTNSKELELFGKPVSVQFAKAKSDLIVQREGEEQLEEHKRKRLAEKERRQAETQASKKKKTATRKPTKKAGPAVRDELLPPNKILFLQNMPDGITAERLTAEFEKFNGLMEVRMVPGRSGIAFVEYESETSAIMAKETLIGFKFNETDEKVVKITYARK